jgi:tRNA (cmo5U34)-methyltransferase
MTQRSGDWGEDNSTFFLEYGDVITPSRQEQIDMITSLVPAETAEKFSAVDLACGAGLLGSALLQRFPQCRVLALDGAPEMLEAANQTAANHRDRFEARLFDLRKSDWLQSIAEPVRCFVSSLSVHHLDGDQKRELFRNLIQKIEPGGALLVADLVEPVNERATSAYATTWDSLVKHSHNR